MKFALLLLSIIGFVFGSAGRQPANWTYDRDTLYIDSTEVKWSKVFWQSDFGNKSLRVILDDTSETGYADDSVSIKIEAYQVFCEDQTCEDVSIIGSRAHPDSSVWPYSSIPYVITDNLDIANTDTASQYVRIKIPIVSKIHSDTIGWEMSDDLDSLVTQQGGQAYYPAIYDYSEGVVYKITGLAGNDKSSGGVMVILDMRSNLGTKVQD